MQSNNVTTLQSLENSPDLKCVGFLKEKLASKTITNKSKIVNKLIKLSFCHGSFLHKVKNSIDNMPNRIEAVIATKGGGVLNIKSGLNV